MPRIRTLKPEFWTDERVGELTRDERLLFLGLISNADDQGRFRAAASTVRATVFPQDDDVTKAMVEGWLASLHRVGVVVLYSVDGADYGAIAKWAKHQKVNHPARPRIPEPPCSSSQSSRGLLEPSRGDEQITEPLAPHTSDLRPPTSDLRPGSADRRPPTGASAPPPLDPGLPRCGDVTAEVEAPDSPPPREVRTPRFGRPVVPASEVVRVWNETMTPVGYPEAVMGREIERAIDAVTSRSPYHTLGWWEQTVFPAVHGSWCGVPARPKGGPVSLMQLAGWGEAKILDMVARHGVAKRAPPPPPRPREDPIPTAPEVSAEERRRIAGTLRRRVGSQGYVASERIAAMSQKVLMLGDNGPSGGEA